METQTLLLNGLLMTFKFSLQLCDLSDFFKYSAFYLRAKPSSELSTTWSCRSGRKPNDHGLTLLPATVTDGLTALDE